MQSYLFYDRKKKLQGKKIEDRKKIAVVVAGHSTESHRLWIKHDWDESLYFYYPKLLYRPDQILAAMMLSQYRVLSKTIRPPTPYHAQCMLWGTLLRRGLWFVRWRPTRNRLKERDPMVHGQIESHNTNLQAIDFNQSCSEQAHFTRTGIGNRYESTKPGYIHTELCVPSIICALGDTRLVLSVQLSSRQEMGQLYRMFWPSNP